MVADAWEQRTSEMAQQIAIGMWRQANVAKVGQTVSIEESRPYSKTKTWKLVEAGSFLILTPLRTAAQPRQPPVAEDAAPAVPGARARGPSYPFETAALGAAAVAVLGGILPA